MPPPAEDLINNISDLKIYAAKELEALSLNSNLTTEDFTQELNNLGRTIKERLDSPLLRSIPETRSNHPIAMIDSLNWHTLDKIAKKMENANLPDNPNRQKICSTLIRAIKLSEEEKHKAQAKHSRPAVLFRREMKLSKVQQRFIDKFVANGKPLDEIRKFVLDMNEADINQVQTDLKRCPKIIIVNKRTGTKEEFVGLQFFDPGKTPRAKGNVKDFLRTLANRDPVLYDHLTHYLHQGALLHFSENLMTNYFNPDFVFFKPSNRTATFTIEKNGNLTYQEKFDITEITSPNFQAYNKTDNQPIASFSFESVLSVKKGGIDCRHSKVDATFHDTVATKFFERGRFEKFLSFLKESVHALFSTTKKEELRKREEDSQKHRGIPSVQKKM